MHCLLMSRVIPPPIVAGKPKGVVHTTGGYMVYTATTAKHGAHGMGLVGKVGNRHSPKTRMPELWMELGIAG